MSAGARAPVAAVIVTRNSAAYVEDCLASLERAQHPPAEIVVVDSGSTDDTAARVRAASPRAQLVLCGTNAGFCRANNLGIAKTTAPFVLVLNPDTKLDERFLEVLLDAFDDPRVGVAAGKLLRFDGVTLDSAGQLLGRSRQPIDRGYGERDDGSFERDGEVFSACGAAALYRRAALDGAADPGGEYFDEAFFAYYEDLDLAWRMRRLGYVVVYRHRAVGYHHRGGAVAVAGTGRKRFRALAARDPELRLHIVKNRWLTILRNDTPGDALRNLPWILARDAATFVFLLATSPGVLVRLWHSRGLVARALTRRRLDSRRAGHHVPEGLGPGPEGGSVREHRGTTASDSVRKGGP